MANLSDTKNTPVKTIVPSSALGGSHALAEFPEAGHKVNVDRRSADGGKRLGRIQIAIDADGAGAPRMLIARGGRPTDVWDVTDDTVASITPTYNVIPAPTVGVGTDLKPDFNTTAHANCGIASVPFPVVLGVDLVDIGNAINYHEDSGKSRGTVVLVHEGAVLVYAIASGGKPSDPWVLSSGVSITPIGTLRPATSTEHADYKPKVVATTYINSVDFPVIASADLVDLGFTELYSEEEHSLVFLHETAVIRDAGGTDLALMYALVDTGSVTWVDLGGSIADVVPS